MKGPGAKVDLAALREAFTAQEELHTTGGLDAPGQSGAGEVEEGEITEGRGDAA